MVIHYEVYAIILDLNINFKKISYITIFITVFMKSSLNLDLLITHLKPSRGNFSGFSIHKDYLRTNTYQYASIRYEDSLFLS